MNAFYEQNLQRHSEDVSLENFLLFLLGHALHSDDRGKLETQLNKLYGFALNMCNTSPPAVMGESDYYLSELNLETADDDTKDNTDCPHDVAWYSGEFRKCLQD